MRKLATWLLAAAGVFVFGSALADLTVKDGGGVTRTMKNFVCETTKLCNATVLIKSDGTEIGTSSAEVFVGGRGTAGSAAGGVLTVQGSASGTAIPVSLASVPSHAVTAASGAFASGSLASGSMVDLLTVIGTKNAGTGAASSLLAGGIYNSTPLTLTNGQQSSLQFDANGYLKTNVTNTNANGQAAAASSAPVVIAKNSGTGSTVAGAAVGTAGSASAEVVTVQGVASMTPILARPSDGTRNATLDACESNAQSYAPISITTATTTRIVTPSASNKTYICSLFLTSAAADNVAVVEGTGGTCGTGTAGVVGGTTAANGMNFAANGGVMMQAGGKVAVAQTAGTNVDLCLITSAATPLAGGIKYVQAP